MWLKIVCVVVLTGGALARSDELLESLYGLRGGNQLDVCVATPSGWRRCAGALYSRDCLLVRARCLATAPVTSLTAELRALGGSCERLASGTWDMGSTRQVYHVAMHPWFDLALATVARPYSYLDSHANATETRLKLMPHGVYQWMKHYFDIAAMTRNQYSHANRLSPAQNTRHRALWFFVTMLLPAALYMLVFIYITMYTGKKVPYKKRHYSKKVTPHV